MQTDQQNIYSNKSLINSSTQILNCPCKLITNTKNLVTCPSCKNFQHQECLKDSLKMKNYQCPSCQLKESDFFIKPLYNILPPSLIKHEKSEIKFQQSFSLDSEFIKFTENLLKNNNSSSTTNMKYIMIRCLRLDEEGYEHHWPFNCVINLNMATLKSFNLPKYPPRSKSRVDYPITFYFKPEDANQNVNHHNLHKDYFFTLNKHMNLLQNKKNVIDIKIEYNKNDNDKYSYVLSIDLVEIIKDKEEVIKSIPIVTDIKSLKLFFAQYNSNDMEDFDITASEKINLIDCYTNSQRIRIPVRSVNCSHLSVFDLGYFLQINRKNKSYECPICKKKATRLYVDGFILNYLKENPNSSEVVLSQNYEICSGLVSVNEVRNESDREGEKNPNNSIPIKQNLNINGNNHTNINLIDMDMDNSIEKFTGKQFNGDDSIKNQNPIVSNFITNPPLLQSENMENKQNEEYCNSSKENNKIGSLKHNANGSNLNCKNGTNFTSISDFLSLSNKDKLVELNKEKKKDIDRENLNNGESLSSNNLSKKKKFKIIHDNILNKKEQRIITKLNSSLKEIGKTTTTNDTSNSKDLSCSEPIESDPNDTFKNKTISSDSVLVQRDLTANLHPSTSFEDLFNHYLDQNRDKFKYSHIFKTLFTTIESHSHLQS